MPFLFDPPSPTCLTIRGRSQGFPVRRVYCVGQNYADHAIEMGSDGRGLPFFFCKHRENVHQRPHLPYPPLTRDLQHEVELVVALRAGGAQMALEQAWDCVFGYAVGLDLTRRDLQREAKQQGRPWEAAKAFEGSAPVSELVPGGPLWQGPIWLDVNGERRQQGDLNQMIWKIPEILVQLSRQFELAAGDLIFTGTPAGVGSLVSGDLIHAGIEGVGDLRVRID